jgi:nucleotide-binding universal stress UspA family protein
VPGAAVRTFDAPTRPAEAPHARAAAPERRVTPYIVLVGLDLSEPGGRAWRFAFDLAELRGEAEIHAVVTADKGLAPPVPDVATPGVSTAHEAPSALKLPPLKVLQHRSAGGQARLMAMHFRVGPPDKAIVKLAHEIGADLIVVATQPTTRIQRLLGGSVADRIARNAPCPVVVVRPKQDDEDPGLSEYHPLRR